MTIEGSAPFELILFHALYSCHASEVNFRDKTIKVLLRNVRFRLRVLPLFTWGSETEAGSTLFLVPLRVETNISEEHPWPFHMVNSN